MKRECLLEIVRPFGQEHLLAFWDGLDPPERETLARQIEVIDFPLLRRLYEGHGRQCPFVVPPSGGSSRELPPKGGTTNEPPPGVPVGLRGESLQPATRPAVRRRSAPRRAAWRDPGGRRAGDAAGLRPAQGNVPHRAALAEVPLSDSRREDRGRRPALRRADSALCDDQPGDAPGNRGVLRRARAVRAGEGRPALVLPRHDARRRSRVRPGVVGLAAGNSP